MPPKRQIKSNLTKPKPLPVVQSSDDQDDTQPTEAELRFDQEVLWCISQFERLLNSGKLPEAKRNETIKAINTLRRQNVSKIQKISLMKQYFKDYKSKMLKDEELVKNQSIVNLQIDENNSEKGLFVKRKINKENNENKQEFLFNFSTPIENDVNNISSNIESIKI